MQFPLSVRDISSLSIPKSRDFETISRSILKKVGFVPKVADALLSGESIENFCDFTLMGNGEFSVLDSKALFNPNIHNFFLKSDDLSKLIACTDGLKLPIHVRKLMLHNSDIVHTPELLSLALEMFTDVFVTNWLNTLPGVHPMPIGLENQAFLRNGIQRDFLRLRNRGILSFEDRPITILSSFNVNTNPVERKLAQDSTNDLEGTLKVPTGVLPRNYRYLVANSKYVLSPPGNGPDCHRTWEAIYLGAIPIVKRAFWPHFEFPLPVVVVDDWSQVAETVKRSTVPEYANIDWQNDFWKLVKYE